MNWAQIPAYALLSIAGGALGFAANPFFHLLRFAKYPVGLKRARRFVSPLWAALAVSLVSLAFVVAGPMLVANYAAASIVAAVPLIVVLVGSWVPPLPRYLTLAFILLITLPSLTVFVGYDRAPDVVAQVVVGTSSAVRWTEAAAGPGASGAGPEAAAGGQLAPTRWTEAPATLYVNPRQRETLIPSALVAAVADFNREGEEAVLRAGFTENEYPLRLTKDQVSRTLPGYAMADDGEIAGELVVFQTPEWAWWWPGPRTIRLTGIQGNPLVYPLHSIGRDSDGIQWLSDIRRGIAGVARSAGKSIAPVFFRALVASGLLDVQVLSVSIHRERDYLQPGTYALTVQNVMP